MCLAKGGVDGLVLEMAEALSLGILPRPLAATLNLIIDIPLFLAIYRQGLGMRR